MSVINTGVPGGSISTLTSNTQRSAVILLRVQSGHYREAYADAQIRPGHLVKTKSTGNVVVQSEQGSQVSLTIAQEDSLQGRTITGSGYLTPAGNGFYEVGNVVRLWDLGKGDVFQGRVGANALSVNIGDRLTSAGDGTFKKVMPGTSLLSTMLAPSGNLSNSTTANFSGGGYTNYTIAAGTPQAGDTYRVTLYGNLPTTAGSDTFQGNISLNGNMIFSSQAVDPANNDSFKVVGEFTFQTVGASGAIVGAGSGLVGTAGTATEKDLQLLSTAVDTTAAITLRATGAWSANTTNIAVLRNMVVEKVSASLQGVLVEAEEAIDNSASATDAFIILRVL